MRIGVACVSLGSAPISGCGSRGPGRGLGGSLALATGAPVAGGASIDAPVVAPDEPHAAIDAPTPTQAQHAASETRIEKGAQGWCMVSSIVVDRSLACDARRSHTWTAPPRAALDVQSDHGVRAISATTWVGRPSLVAGKGVRSSAASTQGSTRSSSGVIVSSSTRAAPEASTWIDARMDPPACGPAVARKQ
jgi:hypothetical protein